MDKAVAWTNFLRCVVLARAAGPGKLVTNGETSRYPSCLRPGITVLALYLENVGFEWRSVRNGGCFLFYNRIGPESDSELRSNWIR